MSSMLRNWSTKPSVRSWTTLSMIWLPCKCLPSLCLLLLPFPHWLRGTGLVKWCSLGSGRCFPLERIGVQNTMNNCLPWQSVGECCAKPGKYSWWFCKLVVTRPFCVCNPCALWLPFICSSAFILSVHLCSIIIYQAHRVHFTKENWLGTCCIQSVFLCLLSHFLLWQSSYKNIKEI